MDPLSPRDAEAHSSPYPEGEAFTGENHQELQRFLIDSIRSELMEDPDSPLLSFFRGDDVNLHDIRVAPKIHPAHADTVFHQVVSSRTRENTRKRQTILLHPDVQAGSPFETIATEVREHLLAAPHTILTMLQDLCTDHLGKFPEGIYTLPCVEKHTDLPLFRDTRYSTYPGDSIACPDLLQKSSKVRMNVVERVMHRVETFHTKHPGNILIGCERENPWVLQLYQRQLEPAQHFIQRLYPSSAGKPKNVHLDRKFRPSLSSAFEKEPRVDDLVELQTHDNDFVEEDVRRWRETIEQCAEDFAEVWVTVLIEQSERRDVAVRIYVQPKSEGNA